MNYIDFIAMLIDMNSARNPYYTMQYHVIKEICNQQVDRMYYYQPQNLLAHVLVEEIFGNNKMI